MADPTDSRHIEYLPLDDIVGAPRNPKKHNTDGLIASIGRFGYATPALRDERTGRLVVGHGRTEAVRQMRDAGETAPAGVQVDEDGRWLVPVVCGWASRSDAEAEAYLVADNRHTELGGWDHQELADLLVDVQAFDPDLVDIAGWDLADLDALLADEATDLPPALSDPDGVPAPPRVPASKPGDLWLLGPHRLLCGDAEDVLAHDVLLDGKRPTLLLMDPPYGMRLDTDYSTIKGSLGSIGRAKGTQGNKYAPVIGDHEDYDPQPILGLFEDVAEQFWWGADYYAERIPGRTDGAWLVWDKRKESQADAIGSEFELCWTRAKHKRRMLRHEWFGFLSSESPTEARNRVHPTQKPVALYVDILDQWGRPGARVLDLYGGSGTTVIACQQMGMTAYVMELSPDYVDIIAKRYQEATGDLPILAATGEPHDFTT